jgi:hypothetical protein
MKIKAKAEKQEYDNRTVSLPRHIVERLDSRNPVRSSQIAEELSALYDLYSGVDLHHKFTDKELDYMVTHLLAVDFERLSTSHTPPAVVQTMFGNSHVESSDPVLVKKVRSLTKLELLVLVDELKRRYRIEKERAKKKMITMAFRPKRV